MSRKNVLVLIAGAAIGLGGNALAQTDSVDQSRAYAAELMSDASGRESLLAAGDTGPTWGGLLQFRYIWDNRAEDAPDGNESTEGFQTARTQLWVQGTIADSWGYYVKFDFDRDGGGAGLLDAYGTYKFENDWTLMWGQFKLPFYREQNIGDQYQQAVERSTLDSTFSQGRSQGIQLGHEGESFRFKGAISDGIRSANSDIASESADFALTARFDWKWSGAWEQFNQFSSWRNSTGAGMIGAAAHYESGGDSVGSVDNDVFGLTADVSYEGNGWNIFGAGVWTRVDTGASSDFDDYGLLVQAGVFLNDNWELFGRVDMVIPDGDRAGDEEFTTVTIGVSDYFIPQSVAAKLTIDLVYYLDDPSESDIVPTSTQTVLLPDTDDGQWALRAQMQLVF